MCLKKELKEYYLKGFFFFSRMRHGAQDPKEAWILISIGEIDFLRTAWEDSAVNVESQEVITTLGLVIWKLPSEKQTGNRVTVDFDDIQAEGGAVVLSTWEW